MQETYEYQGYLINIKSEENKSFSYNICNTPDECIMNGQGYSTLNNCRKAAEEYVEYYKASPIRHHYDRITRVQKNETI